MKASNKKFYVIFFLICSQSLFERYTFILAFSNNNSGRKSSNLGNFEDELFNYINYSNHRKERQLYLKIVKEFDKLAPNEREVLIKSLEEYPELSPLVHMIKNRGLVNHKFSLKEIVELMPNMFFDNKTSIEQKPNFNKKWKVNKEFGSFLDEMEKLYHHEHLQDKIYEDLFQSNNLRENIKIMRNESTANPDNNASFQDYNATNGNKKIEDKDYYYSGTRKTKKIHFISEHHREIFKNHLDEYFASKFNPENIRVKNTVKDKEKEHTYHYYKAKERQNNVEKKQKTKSPTKNFSKFNNRSHNTEDLRNISETDIFLENNFTKYINTTHILRILSLDQSNMSSLADKKFTDQILIDLNSSFFPNSKKKELYYTSKNKTMKKSFTQSFLQTKENLFSKMIMIVLQLRNRKKPKRQ